MEYGRPRFTTAGPEEGEQEREEDEEVEVADDGDRTKEGGGGLGVWAAEETGKRKWAVL